MTSSGPGFLARIGLALARPRCALALAADRKHAGRSGTDLIALIAIIVVATQLRGIVGALWIAKDVEAGLGVRGVLQVLTRALTVDLAFLLLGALVLWAGAGPRRDLGRAFDLACVAVIPLLVVELVATAVVRGAGVTVPESAGWILAGLSWGWSGALLALAWRPARMQAAVPPPPGEVVRPARVAGIATVVVAVAVAALQTVSITNNLDRIRPLTEGVRAPALALRAIGQGGALGERRAVPAGKPVLIEFWATWCQPCIKALATLDTIARRHPDLEVIAINLDDAEAARALFDKRGFQISLLADDGATSERYGVSTIPHIVAIDRDGTVRAVMRGSTAELARVVEEIRK